jgi:hypothetical protein
MPVRSCHSSTASSAPGSGDEDGVFRIVHPFHPGHGQRFAIVTVRQNWGEELLYYRNEEERLVSIPARWTDRVAFDPVVTISAGRSPFRLQDLLELTRLLEALGQEVPRGH